jgi:hypothetical protein
MAENEYHRVSSTPGVPPPALPGAPRTAGPSRRRSPRISGVPAQPVPPQPSHIGRTAHCTARAVPRKQTNKQTTRVSRLNQRRQVSGGCHSARPRLSAMALRCAKRRSGETQRGGKPAVARRGALPQWPQRPTPCFEYLAAGSAPIRHSCEGSRQARQARTRVARARSSTCHAIAGSEVQ